MKDSFSRQLDPVDLQSIVRYSGASGDFNPMHYDRELARSEGFPDAFAQGMLTAGLLAGAVAEIYGPRSIRSFGVRFVAPVFVGEELTVQGETRKAAENGWMVDLKVTVDDRTVLTGWTEIIEGDHAT